MTQSLSNFYRTKEIYIKLPSGGKWYKNKPRLTDDGEIGVYPMSFKDEMLLKIPDSLYNGESLYDVIKSVCPDIIDPYEVAMSDVDVILIASRISNNDGNLQVNATCPHCNTTENYLISIPNILSNVKTIEQVEIELPNKLTIQFKPNTLRSMTASSIKTTEAVSITQNLTSDLPPDQAKKLFEESLSKTTAATMVLIADGIEAVILPDGSKVTTVEEIIEWLNNIDGATMKTLQRANKMQNQNGINDKFKFSCSNESCSKEFESAVEFNPTFFFTNN